MLDDNALDPRNLCGLVFHVKVRFMSPDQVAGSYVNGFGKPELQQWVVNTVSDMFCNCMPVVAQKL
jgi:hypothetical protein